MYTIIHKDTDEEYYVYFEGSYISGYESLEAAQAAIKRLKKMDEQDRIDEDRAYANTGPSCSPSTVWDGLYWAD